MLGQQHVAIFRSSDGRKWMPLRVAKFGVLAPPREMALVATTAGLVIALGDDVEGNAAQVVPR